MKQQTNTITCFREINPHALFSRVATIIVTSVLLITGTSNTFALEVNITKTLEYVDTAHEGKVVRIQRIQDQENTLRGGFTKTSRKCPPFCVQPIIVAPGVTTVGELELLEFIDKKLNSGRGVLIDARTPAWHMKGTIPGSVNIPFTTFSDTNDKLVLGAALSQLGVKRLSKQSVITSIMNNIHSLLGNHDKIVKSKWNFDEAKDLLLWCNGMWCGQSPRAIKGLLKLGYPAEKIKYYRGGMQSWSSLGLTVVIPTSIESR